MPRIGCNGSPTRPAPDGIGAATPPEALVPPPCVPGTVEPVTVAAPAEGAVAEEGGGVKGFVPRTGMAHLRGARSVRCEAREEHRAGCRGAGTRGSIPGPHTLAPTPGLSGPGRSRCHMFCAAAFVGRVTDAAWPAPKRDSGDDDDDGAAVPAPGARISVAPGARDVAALTRRSARDPSAPQDRCSARRPRPRPAPSRRS